MTDTKELQERLRAGGSWITANGLTIWSPFAERREAADALARLQVLVETLLQSSSDAATGYIAATKRLDAALAEQHRLEARCVELEAKLQQIAAVCDDNEHLGADQRLALRFVRSVVGSIKEADFPASDAAVREECARIVEEFSDYPRSAKRKIAAAIRASGATGE
jgi:hypothetical protein